jgi:1A family penicillin-binding protein
MSDETKIIPTQEGPAEDGRSDVAPLGAHRGNGNGNGVPEAKVRIGPQTEDPDQTPPAYTQAIPNVDGPFHQPGNGRSARLPGVRPVKVRVSNGADALRAEHHPGGLNGDASLPTNGNGTGNGTEHGYKARVASTTNGNGRNTLQLRDTDLTGLRLRLKREEWTYAPASRRRLHGRPLPFFLMRHRNMRARAMMGYTRTQLARKRYGGGGAFVVVLRVLLVLAILAGMAGGAGLGGAVAGASWYIENRLPPVTELHGLQVQTTKIYDRNGEPLFDIVDEDTGRRHYLPLKDISPLVISATIATEDATFFTNPGVDPVGIARAFYINLEGKGRSGASTITQQLVRQVNLPPEEAREQSFTRKIREAVQALRFTRYYSKDDILEMYLNENYYGHRAYGIDAAALSYFGKSAHDLTLSEAAMLAGLPQAPTEFDPFVNPDLAKRRQAIVLDLMAKQGMITYDQANAAKVDTLVLRPYQPKLRAPHFVYYVKEYLEKMYGPSVGEAGLVVTTTLDLKVQEAAEQVAKDRIEELRRQKATNASIVIMKPGTGEILAMVGSVDYNNTAIDGQVNVATRERQPGSSFKPITYAAAFEQGWTPGTVLLDTLTAFPNPGQKPYTPKNYDGRDHGWVTVREALGNSYNIPAVKALQFAGLQNVIDTAHNMGIQGLNRGTDWYGLSLTLGGGEVTLLDMTTAYSTFANGGVAVPANPILQIEDPEGRIINRADPDVKSHGKQALDPRRAFMITSILSDNRARSAAFGPNSPLKVSFPAAAKTGTTDDNRDSWTMGYTPNLTVGVWVGNSNNDEMLKVTGAIGAAVIWHNMMETFYSKPEFVELVRSPDGALQKDFVQPEGLIKASACSAKGGITDLFLKDAPPKGCTTYKDKNKQLHAAPSDAPKKPETRPTPLPGIWPPLQPSP